MRILYGVQATGNGHISRARALLPALQQAGFCIDFVFSGRPVEQLFAMTAFGDFRSYAGLTFQTNAGRLDLWQTIRHAKLNQLFHDCRKLDTREYDVVLTDYEPVTAWAARQQKTLSIGLGHQYAFLHDIPKVTMGVAERLLFRYFAPADDSIGVHWHHFNAPLLPPLLHLNFRDTTVTPYQILVYLPFESIRDIEMWLKPLVQYQFVIVHPAVQGDESKASHLCWRKPDLNAFAQTLQSAEAVLSNAGFELISEALQLKKRILVKPLLRQPEQESNAKALAELGVADVCTTLTTSRIAHWLAYYQPQQYLQFADVANAFPAILAHRVKHGCWPQQTIQALWRSPEAV